LTSEKFLEQLATAARKKANAMAKEVDWIKGIHHTLFSFKLPRGFHLDFWTAQHESGKVTVQQSISLSMGFVDFSNLTTVIDESHGSIKMMDKLNNQLKSTIEV
jgi:hypothetical protein